MVNDFDKAALTYDSVFTHSAIGKAQRRLVYAAMTELFKQNRPVRILEINCGTGQDAQWLARQNLSVTATDISEAMIGAAKSKSIIGNPTFSVADINELGTIFKGEKFDLIFSNFGGLNCLSVMSLGQFFRSASHLLSDNGQLALVIMPKNTKWEQLFFLAKADFKNVFRRKKGPIVANVEGQNVMTYYYNPKETARLADLHFNVGMLRPIGFLVPPSYLEPFFGKRPALLSLLETLENSINNWRFLARHSDHYFIHLTKK